MNTRDHAHYEEELLVRDVPAAASTTAVHSTNAPHPESPGGNPPAAPLAGSKRRRLRAWSRFYRAVRWWVAARS